MFRGFLRIYEKTQVNSGERRSLLAETEIFNEGFLLAGILQIWKTWDRASRFRFMPFPTNSEVRAPVQLYTCFKKMRRHDNVAETNTRADGVAGQFKPNKSKSGIVFPRDLSYFTAFEGKMYSPYSPIKNAEYSQVARTISCMMHAAVEAELAGDYRLFFVTLYPADTPFINPAKFTREFIKQEIEGRIAQYKGDGRSIDAFEQNWRAVWARTQTVWATWEEVVEEIGDPDLRDFYLLCKRFNEKKPAA